MSADEELLLLSLISSCVIVATISLVLSCNFEMVPLSTTGDIYKLYKKRSSAVVRQKFSSERIVNYGRPVE